MTANLEAAASLEAFAVHVKTKDEHMTGDQSVRPFPVRAEKEYIWDLLDTFRMHKIVAIEKSRQLMVTWLCCLYALWIAKYQQNRVVFIQSRKEENAANLVFNQDVNQARISFMESHLPKELQSKFTPSYGKMFFHDSGSLIQGIPEGGDMIRSYVPSLLICDEAAFQPEFELAWRAAKPCIDGGGQAIIVSTAKNGSFMKTLLRVA